MKKGLILEGGALRGMFTAGVMDVLMENGIEFDGAVGVSAGAVFRPKGHRSFDDGARYFHHPTQVPFWFVRSPFRVRFVFARCQVTALTTIHSTFTMPNTP